MSAPQSPRILIVGGVAGGASAATRARRMNEQAEIILFEKDENVSFANCGMPYHIGGEIQERENLLVASPDLLRDRFSIDVRTFHEVMSINLDNKQISGRNTRSRTEFIEHFDKLILAPGASPLVPTIPGADSENVFTLRNLADMDRIIAHVKPNPKQSVAVVGAGFIGIEMAEQLARIGSDTVVVELMDQVLPPLDPEMAKPVQQALESNGVRVSLGSGIKGFVTSSGTVTAIQLDNGQEIDTDAVILGMGVRPNVQMAKDAGIELGEFGGIRVNEFMQTSHPDVYAVGDAVEYRHGVLGIDMRVPLAGPANRAGRIAGEHAATGHGHRMQPVLGTAILRAFDTAAGMTGLSEKQAARNEIDARSVTIIGNDHAGYFPGATPMKLKLIYEAKNGRVLGAQAVGQNGVDKRIDVIATAISFGATVEQLAGLDLVYAPPFGSAKDPVHMVAFAAMNDLDALTPVINSGADLSAFQVLDVRNQDEIDQQPCPGAVEIPLNELRARISELDSRKPTAVVCQSGLRAHSATRILKQSGFGDVRNVSGGMTMRTLAQDSGTSEST